MKKESTNHRNGFLMEKPCLLLTNAQQTMNLPLEETTSFYRVNATLLIDEIEGEKEKIIITRRHYHYGE
jgi:hypothetical protein